MKVKTHELVGIQLDAAVALALGGANLRHDTVSTWWVTIDGKDRALSSSWAQAFCPSTNWAHAGPIIEANCMEFDYDEGTQTFRAYDGVCGGDGKTHMVAAMRCLVAAKFGDEVELPDHLAAAV